MSIEENEGFGLRGFLGTAFAEAEPPLRELASGSIARGDAARRRNRRLVAAGGAVLTAAVVIGTFAVVTGATSARHGNPNPGNPVTSEPSPVRPSGFLGFGPQPISVSKIEDLAQRLPAALQPLLPAGITVGQVRSDSDLLVFHQVSGILTGPTGTNRATMWVGSPPKDDRAGVAREVACRPGGTCRTRTVDGGTIYLDEHVNTEADQVLTGSGFPPDVLKPGTEKKIVGRSLSMTFVPDDPTRYAFNFEVAAATAQVQYADHEPADAEPGMLWPPTWNTVPAYDPSGPMLSADDLVAMLTKPGLDKAEYLLDPRTPVSQDARDKMAAVESQIVDAAAEALPPGVRPGIDSSKPEPRLSLTGPTGKNEMQWTASVLGAQQRGQRYGNCSGGLHCATDRKVPGGTLLVLSQYPHSDSTTPLDVPSLVHYVFLPDDASKPVLDMMLAAEPLVPQSGTSDPAAAPGGLPAVHGPFAPLQVSQEQFLNAAESGRLETAITTTKSLLDALQ